MKIKRIKFWQNRSHGGGPGCRLQAYSETSNLQIYRVYKKTITKYKQQRIYVGVAPVDGIIMEAGSLTL